LHKRQTKANEKHNANHTNNQRSNKLTLTERTYLLEAENKNAHDAKEKARNYSPQAPCGLTNTRQKADTPLPEIVKQ
jgi:hypothetical protein